MEERPRPEDSNKDYLLDSDDELTRLERQAHL